MLNDRCQKKKKKPFEKVYACIVWNLNCVFVNCLQGKPPAFNLKWWHCSPLLVANYV